MNNLSFLVSLGLSTSSIDEDLLQQTLTHKSYAMDYPVWEVSHNERLEFLGDSILGAVVARLLYDQFGDITESQLTLSKIFLVREQTLATVARNIDLWTVIRIGTGESRSGWADKDSVLSDGLEALIAYIYLQYGRETVEQFITEHIYILLWNQPVMPQKSRKNQLQELIQKYHNEIPRYDDMALETNASGDVTLFWSDVYVLDQLVCRGTWTNKKKAQENGAEQAMSKLDVRDGKVILEA